MLTRAVVKGKKRGTGGRISFLEADARRTPTSGGRGVENCWAWKFVRLWGTLTRRPI